MPYVDRVAETALSNHQHFRQTIDTTGSGGRNRYFSHNLSWWLQELLLILNMHEVP